MSLPDPLIKGWEWRVFSGGSTIGESPVPFPKSKQIIDRHFAGWYLSSTVISNNPYAEVHTVIDDDYNTVLTEKGIGRVPYSESYATYLGESPLPSYIITDSTQGEPVNHRLRITIEAPAQASYMGQYLETFLIGYTIALIEIGDTTAYIASHGMFNSPPHPSTADISRTVIK